MSGNSRLEVETLRLLKTYYDIQKLRVATELRVEVNQFTLCPNRHLIPAKTERDTCPKCGAKATLVIMEPSKVLADIKDGLEKLEKMLYKELEQRVSGHPLYVTYLRHIRGVGPATGAYLITVLNPAKFETVSKMWKYTGLHVVDGKAPRRVAGKQVDWNPVARTMMWKLGENFRMVGGFYKYMYRKFYDESLEKHKDWTKAHHLNHARRVTVKLFLSHWYVVGRVLQGLPVRKPYICEVRPHECIPPILDTKDSSVIQYFYEYVIKPLGWWSEKEYYDWVVKTRTTQENT